MGEDKEKGRGGEEANAGEGRTVTCFLLLLTVRCYIHLSLLTDPKKMTKESAMGSSK